MTTSSDRLLLRWVPLAAFLAVVMAVALSFGPNQFGFHGWPKAPAPRSIDRVVRVTPTEAPVAIARREPVAHPAAEHADATRPARRRPVAAATRAPRSSSERPRARGHGEPESTPAPVRSPAPPGTDGDHPVAQTPDDTPLAQAPDDGIRHTAEAKREAPQVTPPDITVDVELDLGRGHGHGRGHHGRRGWH